LCKLLHWGQNHPCTKGHRLAELLFFLSPLSCNWQLVLNIFIEALLRNKFLLLIFKHFCPGTNQYLCHMKKHSCDQIRARTHDPWVERQTHEPLGHHQSNMGGGRYNFYPGHICFRMCIKLYSMCHFHNFSKFSRLNLEFLNNFVIWKKFYIWLIFHVNPTNLASSWRTTILNTFNSIQGLNKIHSESIEFKVYFNIF
jgi:hypothetical protein